MRISIPVNTQHIGVDRLLDVRIAALDAATKVRKANGFVSSETVEETYHKFVDLLLEEA